MTYQTITYEPGAVARVILDRPGKLNAQSWVLLEEMDDAFNQAIKDPVCRIILLSGAGKAFSAGHDLESGEQVADRRARTRDMDDWSRSSQMYDIYTESHLRWRNLSKPTMAMVHGYCIYGGWMIASAMDFIFAARSALFIPTYGDYFTTHWDIGPRKAKEILYENRFLTADEAMYWGFVNRVYADDELEAKTLVYCNRVAGQNPFYTRTVKFQINQTMDGMGFSQSVRTTGEYFLRAPQRPRSAEQQVVSGEQERSRFRNQVHQAMTWMEEDKRSGG